ncbi:MAG: hypothetical protein EZS28_029727 [Streblomastix strix]|uniref:Uncharacterized protein n=1 Tax=Streblomastix strix TaxID=222440 RepID=A0A5J4UVP7_9EUKA|nr:MAG: hypothetical protein EZS28_029727 [Streblomastix strix]
MTAKDININLVALLRSIPELKSENEMLELIKQLHVHIISLDDDILDENIQMDICSELKTQINFSTFQVEKELLNVVGEIAERGVKMGGDALAILPEKVLEKLYIPTLMDYFTRLKMGKNKIQFAFLDALEQIEVNGGIEEIIIHCCNAQYQNKDVNEIGNYYGELDYYIDELYGIIIQSEGLRMGEEGGGG